MKEKINPLVWALLALGLMLLTIGLLSGCSTAKQCAKRYPCGQKTDSLFVEREVVRERTVIDTFTMPADTSYSIALIKCDSTGNAHIVDIRTKNGNRSSSSLALVNNILTSGCKCDSVAIYKTFVLRDTSKHTSVSKTKIEIQEIEKRLTWLQKQKINYGGYAMLLVALYIALKVAKWTKPLWMPYVGQLSFISKFIK